MINVLFVCLGNICRSPLAEGIFKKLVQEAELGSIIFTDSAGTSRWHIDEPPDRRSVQVAEKNGVNLNHLGRQIKSEDLEKFDYILAMDIENFEGIRRLRKEGKLQKAKIMLMRDYDNKQSGSDIPDPYYGGPNGFQIVYGMLEESLNNFLDSIVKEHKLK